MVHKLRCKNCGRKPKTKVGDSGGYMIFIVECRCTSKRVNVGVPSDDSIKTPDNWVDDKNVAVDSVKKNIKD